MPEPEVKARGIYSEHGFHRCANCKHFVYIKTQGFCDNCSACLSMTCSECNQEMPVLGDGPKFCSLCGAPVSLHYRPIFHPASAQTEA